MQRELKFRCWDKVNKKFLRYDDLAIDLNGNKLLIYDYEFEESDDQDNFILQQYTGLKDSQGKEIYEGDIVKWGHLRHQSLEDPIRIAEVKINPDIQFHSQVGIYPFGSFSYADSTDKDLQIIGNRFETPELLNEVKE